MSLIKNDGLVIAILWVQQVASLCMRSQLSTNQFEGGWFLIIEIPGTLNNEFLMDVWWNNGFTSKGLESSNWKTIKKNGCLEFQEEIYMYIYRHISIVFHNKLLTPISNPISPSLKGSLWWRSPQTNRTPQHHELRLVERISGIF